MDRPERGRIVRSKAGRDKYYYLAVVGTGDGFLILCDGKERPLERPKRKNIKHLAVTGGILTEVQMSTNRALRKALREYAENNGQEEAVILCPKRI